MRFVFSRMLFVLLMACSCIGAEDKPATQKIFFGGDSISVGSGASSGERRYTTVLTGMLNAGGVKYTELNYGISGSALVDQFWPAPNCSGYPYILEKAIAQKPDVFVMQHGTNDNALGHSLGRFLWTYRHTIGTLKEKVPGITIVCMTICPSWDTLSSTDEWLNQANAGIQEIAAMENTLLAQTYFKLQYRKDIFPDGIHPDDEGHRIMAQSVLEVLRENKVQSINDFDLTFRTPGEYRMCGYSISTKGDIKQSPGKWVELYGFGQKEFEYRSDYELKIITPLRYTDHSFVVNVTFEDSTSKKIQAGFSEWCGQGYYTLPSTKGKKAKVKIEL